jgi:hypothetical protein
MLADSPYVGLSPFQAEDAPRFFGREDEAEMVAVTMMSRPLTVLFGQSGVGKSSLVYAGLGLAIGRLETASDMVPEHSVLAICRTWRDDAVEAIDRCLRAAVPELEDVPVTGDLARTAHAVADIRGELFLVLDQFEEYFLYHGPGEDRALTVQLRRMLSDRELAVSILISIRDDALARLERLREIPRLFDNRVELEHLSRTQARAAIEGPLDEFNRSHPDDHVEIEPGLIDVLLRQVSFGSILLDDGSAAEDEPVETAFLQLVLTRLWAQERDQGSSVLRLSTLEELGGAIYIVRTIVDRSVDVLSHSEQTLAADMLTRLVTPSGRKIAMAASDLAAYLRVDESEATAVLDRLTAGDTRLLRVVPGQDGTSRYELYHDVLAEPALDWSLRRRQLDERRQLERELVFRRRRARRMAVMVAVPWLLVVVLVVLLVL